MAIKIDDMYGATPLDPEELDELKPNHITNRGQLNEWEAVNISKGFEWAKKSKIDIFTERFCKLLHKKMFDDTWLWAGAFRKTDKNIGCDKTVISIELKKALDNAKYWVENKTFPIHEIALRLHHSLVYIHPFPNGNGRFARIMADVLIYRNKAKPLKWEGNRDMNSPNENRDNYIDSLKKADLGDFSKLIEYFSPKK